MLKPCFLHKVRLVGLAALQADALALWRRLGVLQIETMKASALGLQDGVPLEDYDAISEQLVRIRAIKAALAPVHVSPAMLEANPLEIAKSIEIEAELVAIKDGIEKLKREIDAQEAELGRIERLLALDIDFLALPAELDYRLLGIAAKKIGELEAKAKAGKNIFWLCAKDGKNPKNMVALIAAPKGSALPGELEAMEQIALPKISGTPRQIMFKIKHEIARAEDGNRELERKKMELSKWYYPKCTRAEEALALAAQLSQVSSAMGRSGECFWAEGWIRAEDWEGLCKETMQTFEGKVFLRQVPESEHGGIGRPTHLENPQVAQPLQYIVELMSTPKADEIDPTMIIFITIPLLYGMIVGDAGYALISFMLAWLISKKAAKGGLLYNLTKLWMIGAIPSFVFGVLFDEYFGYHHAQIIGQQLYAPIISRVHEIPLLLLITIVTGWLHVALGFVFGAINEWEHSRKHAYAKLSWLPIMVGGTMAVGHFLLGAFGADIGMIGAGILAIGVLALVLTEGVLGIVELPGLASNIMSYARIAAVGIAGLMLAEIINEYIAPNPRLLSTPEGILVFALIAILYVALHIVNTIIVMVESTIHGARLNVVEFFGKFYKGGGRPFVPLVENRKYTLASAGSTNGIKEDIILQTHNIG